MIFRRKLSHSYSGIRPIGRYSPFEQLGPGACFSKVPKLFGHISSGVIVFVSSKRRCLEARNFAVIIIHIPFYNIWKDQLHRISGSECYECLFGPETFSGLSRNGPLVDKRKEDFTQVGFDTSTPWWLYQIMFSSLFLLMLSWFLMSSNCHLAILMKMHICSIYML